MKILAFTDIHGSKLALKRIGQKIKKQNPDLLVCAGDVSVFEQGILGIFRGLNKIGKKIVIIHGNHEESGTFIKLSRQFRNIVFIHKNHHIENGVLFLGFGGGGFSATDREFERIAHGKFRKIIGNNKDKKIILITHAPPYGTRLDKIGRNHCSNKSITSFLKKNKIDYLICGHLHENFGKEDRIKQTVIMNPGPFGKIVEV